jgi:hypothetical protein
MPSTSAWLDPLLRGKKRPNNRHTSHDHARPRATTPCGRPLTPVPPSTCASTNCAQCRRRVRWSHRCAVERDGQSRYTHPGHWLRTCAASSRAHRCADEQEDHPSCLTRDQNFHRPICSDTRVTSCNPMAMHNCLYDMHPIQTAPWDALAMDTCTAWFHPRTCIGWNSWYV